MFAHKFSLFARSLGQLDDLLISLQVSQTEGELEANCNCLCCATLCALANELARALASSNFNGYDEKCKRKLSLTDTERTIKRTKGAKPNSVCVCAFVFMPMLKCAFSVKLSPALTGLT